MDMLEALETRLGTLDEPRARSALLCLLQDAPALRRLVLRHGTARAALAAHSPGNAGSHSPGNAGSHSPGNAGSHSPGNAGSHSPGNAGSHSPGNAGSHSPGNAGWADAGDLGPATPSAAADAAGLHETAPFAVLDLDKVVPRVEEDFVLQEKLGTRMLLPGGPDWPRLLDTCVNPPVLLHVLGNPEVLRRPAPLALVGSRQAVQYGSRVAASFASAWARMGGVVVSGGAIGVDTAAHEGCLAAGGSTVAIMGTGLAELHPRRNQALFSAISETGAIASELPMRSRAMPFNFPLRNRLIAALSKAVVVVQARRDSGALHTAHFALKSGRLLFTVPAPVDEESCLGGLDLLVQGVPAMVGTAQLQGLFAQMTGSPSASPRLPLEPGRRIVVRLSDLAPAERNVLELVVQGTCHVDDLLAAGGMEGRELSLALLSLEMRGWVEKAPGNRYISSVRLER